MAATASRERMIKRGTIIAVPVLLILLLILFFEWNWMRGPLESLLSARTERQVRIEGDLDVALAWSPTVTIHRLHVVHPDWVPKGDTASVERLTVTFKLLPLFAGRLILPAVKVEKPIFALIRQESGRANWQFGSTDEPARLPVINSLTLTDGKVTINDAQRRLLFVGTVATHEGAASETKRAFFLEGRGTLNRRAVVVRIEGDPLLNVSADKPYNFDADIRDGVTHITAHGTINRPFNLGRMDAAMTLTGNDLADVYYLTGIALPNTPPYRLSTQLVRQEDNYVLNKLSGRVGDSDLEGTMSVDASGERPFVRANLKSKRLDFDDLGALFGAPPAIGPNETASPAQKREETRLASVERLLPDAPLLLHRVRGTDADVRYVATSVTSKTLPLRMLELHLTLNQGVLTLDPVTVGLVRGHVTGRAQIDARKDVPAVSTDLSLSKVRLEEFFAKQEEPAPLSGEILARVKLNGRGLSVHDAASNASGNLAVVIPRGEIRQAFAELLGINVASGLGLLLTGDQTKTDIRCAVANFRAENGMLRAENVVLDTGVVLATGTGTLNLKTEALDVRVEGHPKELRLLRLMAPITLKGHLRNMELGVDAGKAITQVGIAGALGALLSPLAAILPFVSPGLAEDADCAALLAQAKTSGVAVKAKSAAPSTTRPN